MRKALVLGAAALALTTIVRAQDPITPDVIFIPTGMDVARAMLDLAHVTATDVVYDLGSGDGRIPILAAAMYGAKGVGVELDPDLVARSRASAMAAGVEDRARFVEGDLFATDLRSATVVTLYLAPYLNLRLKPKLLRELKPGSRIVSHEFDMGDWKPDRTVVAGTTRIHLWTVPAK